MPAALWKERTKLALFSFFWGPSLIFAGFPNGEVWWKHCKVSVFPRSFHCRNLSDFIHKFSDTKQERNNARDLPSPVNKSSLGFCFCFWSISSPEFSGSLVSGGVTGENSGDTKKIWFFWLALSKTIVERKPVVPEIFPKKIFIFIGCGL